MTQPIVLTTNAVMEDLLPFSNDLLYTVVELIIGAIGLKTIIQWIWERVTNPLIEVSEVKISRYPYERNIPIYDDDGNIVDSEEQFQSTVVSWRVWNKIRLYIFSKDIHNIYAKYNFERVDSDAPRDYLWSSDTEKWPMLSPDQDIPMQFTLDRYYIPNGEYKLRLNIMSEDKVIKSYQKIVKIDSSGQFFYAR